MRARTPSAAALGLFWFGSQVVWGALLGISLQARATQLVPHDTILAYGELASWGAAAAAVTQIVAGILSDRLRIRGSKRIEFYIAGALAASVALVWFYTARSFAGLLEAVMLLQIAMNAAIGPYQAVIPDFVVPERTGAASSWMAALQSLGNAAGAALAALVSDTRIVVGGIIAALLSTCAATAVHVARLPLLPAASERVRITRAFVDLFVSRAFVYLGFYTLVGYLFFYIAATLAGNTNRLTGITLLIVTASGALGAAAASRAADMLDRRALATAGGGAFVVAIGLLIGVHAFVAIALVAALAGASWGAFLTADWALGCGFMPRAHVATGMGVWNLALLVPQVLAPLVASGIIGALHALQSNAAPRIAFAAAIAEIVLGIAWIWRLPALPLSVKTRVRGNTA